MFPSPSGFEVFMVMVTFSGMSILGLWKLIEIICWVSQHLHWG